MKTLKTKRIFVLIWVMLALSVLASIFVLFESLRSYYPFWLMLIRTINTSILIVITYRLWKIVNAYTNKTKWQPNFYQKLRQIGYWAILLTFLSTVIETTMILSSNNHFVNNLNNQKFFAFMILEFFLKICLQSSGMWVFTLSIFLFAELLQIANQIKDENESII